VLVPHDLLPGATPHGADPEVVRAGPEREAERIPEAVGDDAAEIDVAGRALWVRREPGACRRVDTEDRSVQEHRLTGRSARALAAECTALARRRRVGGAFGIGRLAARVCHRGCPREGPAELAVVGVPEVRAFAPRDV